MPRSIPDETEIRPSSKRDHSIVFSVEDLGNDRIRPNCHVTIIIDLLRKNHPSVTLTLLVTFSLMTLAQTAAMARHSLPELRRKFEEADVKITSL